MCHSRIGVLLCILICAAPVGSLKAQTSQSSSTATKDPQAIAVANQALIAAGGISAITAITDYTATGNITYQLPQRVQGKVTLRALGVGQFRMDAVLPSGTHSEVSSDSHQIRDSGLTRAYPAPMNPSRIAVPAAPLVPALTSPSLNLKYLGIVQLSGRSVHQVEIQRFLSISLSDPNGHFRDFHTMNFFIDASTFQILMIQDVVVDKSVRQIWYSDYRSLSGVQLPYAIAAQMNGQTSWQIALGEIILNSGLQDADFQL